MDYEYNKNFGAFIRNKYNYPIDDYLLNPDELNFGIEYDINVAAIWVGNSSDTYAFCDLSNDTELTLSHSLGALTKFSINSNVIIANSSSKITFNSPIVECSAEIKAQLGTFTSLSAPYKMFDIIHPTKPNKRLRHACLEGPEISVFIKGKLYQTNTIILPDYWVNLVDSESIIVNLTQIGESQDLSVLTIDLVNSKIIIKSNANKIINCFYTVLATRKDVNKLEVEYEE